MCNYLILGSDATGDFMAVYFDKNECHFGNLHHEAWGEVDCWRDEAMSYAKFNDWLCMIIHDPEGGTLPNKEISYELKS